jgi:hypothetical protein
LIQFKEQAATRRDHNHIELSPTDHGNILETISIDL